MYTQEQVLTEVKKRLKKSKIKAICLDVLNKNTSMPSTEEDFDKLVNEIVTDTLYWEGKL